MNKNNTQPFAVTRGRHTVRGTVAVHSIKRNLLHKGMTLMAQSLSNCCLCGSVFKFKATSTTILCNMYVKCGPLKMPVAFKKTRIYRYLLANIHWRYFCSCRHGYWISMFFTSSEWSYPFRTTMPVASRGPICSVFFTRILGHPYQNSGTLKFHTLECLSISLEF